ncbi:TonB family protein [Mucilaginibacter sp. BJC16-A38]|uniref:energy transducer TonB n=1 Tax=Mucilaginibacter phenanthrenivorans TaxID=1234842 RepID=UPI00215859C6|nr:energy transducer TonB [Mucilaginibacter phenanthrenivorans]MCR8556317.1 TonB family protein [Mucilaginibacter phenanthrenivorans]
MFKYLLVFVVSFLSVCAVNAQTGGLVYYLTNSGKLVTSKDSADYSMVVLPPDTSVDKTMYVVYEYYKNGKPKLMANSNTNDLNLQYQGRYVAYFPNGRKSKIGNFLNGRPVGHETKYYPNGKFYSSLDYLDFKQPLLSGCSDSTGRVLAENGNGSWVEYDDNFSLITANGQVVNGLKEGEWKGSLNKYEDFASFYEKGKSLNTTYRYKPGIDTIITKVKNGKAPEFAEGAQGFGKFLAQNIHYPVQARQDGVQGKVILIVVVEKDGTLTNIRVKKGIGDGCDEECVRFLHLSPKWIPGLDEKGTPVRMETTIPISFTLSN